MRERLSNRHIAEILGVSEATIRRDLKAIRKARQMPHRRVAEEAESATNDAPELRGEGWQVPETDGGLRR